jgi:hypothetical protein
MVVRRGFSTTLQADFMALCAGSRTSVTRQYTFINTDKAIFSVASGSDIPLARPRVVAAAAAVAGSARENFSDSHGIAV